MPTPGLESLNVRSVNWCNFVAAEWLARWSQAQKYAGTHIGWVVVLSQHNNSPNSFHTALNCGSCVVTTPQLPQCCIVNWVKVGRCVPPYRRAWVQIAPILRLQTAKLVAALLRVARVTAGLAESNGSLPPGLWLTVTCRLTAKNRDQLRNPIRSAIECGLPLPYWFPSSSIC